jgi:hypothetical protein
MKKYLWIIAAAMALSGSLAIADEGGVHGAGARHHAYKKYVRENTAAATATHTPDDGDLAAQQAQYDFERTAPAGFVSGDAMGNAAQQAMGLSRTGGRWEEFTRVPYNAEPSNYTDPFWSNIGAGFSIVGGRVTALVTTAHGGWFAGAADGGVWRSNDQGQNWTPVFDSMPTLSIGALAADPRDGSLWVGTGEANTSQDSYSGTGVYRSTDHGNTWQRLGDDQAGNNVLAAHTVFRIAFDHSGDAYAATNNGLFRLGAGSNAWTEVLAPAGSTDFPPYDQQVTDVAVQPGSRGRVVIAAIGWHGPGHTQNNGFYQSTDGGHTFASVTPTGDINAPDIGRTTFAYSADGSKLYAIVQSLSMIAAGDESFCRIFVASISGGNPETGRPVDQDRGRGPGRLGLSTGRWIRLRRRSSGLVQPGSGGGPRQSEPRLRWSGRGLRVDRRWEDVGYRKPVLELLLRLRQHGELPEDDASRPARHDDHRGQDRHRKRRRRLQSPAVGRTGER